MSSGALARTETGFGSGVAALSLADQLLVLRRRWRIILAATGLVVCLTCLALALMPIRYTATGILLYDPGRSRLGDNAAPAADLGGMSATTASQAEIIASLPQADALASRLGLAGRPEFNPALRRPFWPWRRRAPAGPDGPAVAAAVRRALGAAMLPDSRVLTVSFTSADPLLAAAAANAAMQLYLNHERDQAFATLNDNRVWLVGNAATLAAGLGATETRLAAARAAAGVVPGTQANLTTETASEIAASLVQAEADLAMNQARLGSASRGQSAAANAAIAPNLLPLRKDQADLSAEVQSLSGEYGPDYPRLRDARASLAAITGEINAETGRELAAAGADVAADQAEVATLRAALASARVQSQTEDADSAPIRALEQQAEASRDMLRDVTLQIDQLAQAASLVRPDARILSEAAVPQAPSTPPRSLLLAAAIGLGLCLGLLLAALEEALDTSLRSSQAVRELTSLPCLALVPEVDEPRALVLSAPFSVFAEQMRALRTGLALAAGADGPRVIAVTAARPGEGKTTLTIALARTLAAAGLGVVAIDGDIRRPNFAAAFRLQGGSGLTDHLAGLASLDEIIERDPESSLDVIAAGAQAAAALSLFLSPALPALLAALRARYDVVLLDVPPVFALAEGRVLAGRADAALLCVRWGETPRRVVAAAVGALREAGVNLAGAVLTRVDATAHGRSGFADSEIYQPRYSGYFRG